MNHLAGETSPYLLQHAHNPVDWYPWGPEALARARAEDRPIFLSIGYAACHWCHVMERESFEDEATAARLNADFVAVKVDREERPDLDAIYMQAVQAMTGQGGWPMSVFLTPLGRPFYGGTYFPAEARYGMPAFREVLAAVAAAWRDRRADVESVAQRLSEAIAAGGAGAQPLSAGPVARSASAPPADPAVLDRAVAALEASFDRDNGGWGTAPKFPQPAAIEFLLVRAATARDARLLSVAERALDAMADGGIHDQLGGGFHRYSTDASWYLPHFEKMLYDNAQLARVYLHAYQLTAKPRHARIAEGALAYLRREMTTPEGLFAASQDADAAGTEGATYGWTLDELVQVLGPVAPLAATAFGVTGAGRWDGRNVLYRAADTAVVAAMHGLEVDEAAARLEDARLRLLAARAARPQPARDDKAVASWNGLAIGAFADAARVLGRPEDLAAATTAGDAALRLLVAPDGRVRRSWRDGRATLPGYLEDHAHLADGLLALYAATFDERWFVAARSLVDAALAHFADPAGGFWETADDHEALIARPRSLEDGPLPSGGAMLTSVLLRLAALTGEQAYRAAAESALAPVASLAARHPTAFAAWLQAIDLATAAIDEVAIVGPLADPGTQTLLRVATRGFHPHRVVAASENPAESRIELLQSRFALRGRPTAFVCRDFSCRQPVTEAEALAAQLAE